MKTKVLISFTVTAKLICIFVFAYADCWFSHMKAHISGNTEDSNEEEVQLTGLPTSITEGSTLQAFVAKAAAD